MKRPEGTPGATVTIGPNGFEPDVLQVPPGTIVEWINLDTTFRSISTTIQSNAVNTLDTGEGWDSGVLDTFGTFEVEVSDTEGTTYTYYDPDNPSDSATIIVTTFTGETYLPVIMKK